MKKILIYSLLFLFTSCVSDISKDSSQFGFRSGGSSSSSSEGDSIISTFEGHKQFGFTRKEFKGIFTTKGEPNKQLNAELYFKNGKSTLKDTLDARFFSRYMKLDGVSRITIANEEWHNESSQVYLEFEIFLYRGNNVTFQRYRVAYTADFKKSKPQIAVYRFLKPDSSLKKTK